jgi:hypothetical protein
VIPEILSAEVPAGGRAEAFEIFHDGLRARGVRVPILLEWDLRAPGEIHRIEPLLPWCDAIGARVQPAKLPILARLAARVERPLRLRVNAGDDPAEIARTCVAEGCLDFGIVVRASDARRVAASLDADPRTGEVPLWIELPDGVYDASIAGGRLLLDGIGDAVVAGSCRATDRMNVDPGTSETEAADGAASDAVGIAYGILQACRVRLTRAEFIACPSCGRTQFDLITTTARIRQRTGHLVGVKIAVMGCVVNGPGEMADADFGYVGSAPGKVDLYVGRTRVKQALPAGEAPDRLCDLIREHGMWVDPPRDDGTGGTGTE